MWDMGFIGVFAYWVKYYETGSDFGINGGRISKLTIRKADDNRDLCNYDRGWDVKPAEEAMRVYEELLKRYN